MKQLVTHSIPLLLQGSIIVYFGLARRQPLWWKWEGNIHCPDEAVAEAEAVVLRPDGFGVIKNVEYT